jgi:hypothetical protein
MIPTTSPFGEPPKERLHNQKMGNPSPIPEMKKVRKMLKACGVPRVK